MRLRVQRGVTHLSSASQRQDLHNLLKFPLFCLGDLVIGMFFFLNQTISYLRLTSEGSNAIKVHSDVFALSHIPYTAPGNWLCYCVPLYMCISTVCVQTCSNISVILSVLNPCYNNRQFGREKASLIIKQLV